MRAVMKRTVPHELLDCLGDDEFWMDVFRVMTAALRLPVDVLIHLVVVKGR